MSGIKSFIKNLKNSLIILYGILLIILIALFFMNYGGLWMSKIAEKTKIVEMKHR